METDETHEIYFHEFVIENDLPAFLFLVLEKLEKCFGLQATDESHTQTQFVLVDKTVHFLISIAESNEERIGLSWKP